MTYDEARALPRPGCRKRAYPTRKVAERALRTLRGRAQRFSGDLPVRAYWHAQCHAWHLTTMHAATSERVA